MGQRHWALPFMRDPESRMPARISLVNHEDRLMSRRCELTGKAVQVGNKVSHSNIKTKTRFLPNLCQVTLLSEGLNRPVRLRITAHALRSVEHRGGLDAFLLKAKDSELSSSARAIKRELQKKQPAA